MREETLVVEILTEELPPRSLITLGRAFSAGLAEALRKGQFLSDDSVVTHFATPRRLAASISRVLQHSPERVVRDKIMPVAVALDAGGAPSVALRKKLAALKLEELGLDDLQRAFDGKTETFYYQRTVPGEALFATFARILPEVIARLPVAKIMRYQVHAGRADESTVQFARPARGILALWGESLIDASALGLATSKATRGHRFLCSGPVTVPNAEAYERTLHEAGRVVASYEGRRDAIREGLLREANGFLVLMPEALLDEVCALVEWPVVYRGTFEDRYLEVPQECLVLTMQQNQRYFALTDEQGRIQSQFLVVSNIETLDPSAIIGGNERVLRARLSDAKFFFDQDRKRTLESRISGLDKIVYHQRLGSMGDRTRRIAQIARAIATDVQCDPVTIERAAVLCKADLVTEMVGEFPELQGIMGRYYALHDGESPAVAQAIEEHYRPRFAKDDVPESKAGQCLALADKLESIVGLFAVGSAPTGDRDPYALRRQALAVLRILSEKALAIRLDRLLELASAAFAGSADPHPVLASVTEFFYERLRSLLKDQGFTPAEIEAVVSLAPERIDLVVEQVKAVRSFAQMPEAASLSAANKRIGNILKKAGSITAEYQVALLTEPAEKALAAELSELEPGVLTFYKAQGYAAGLASLAGLRAPVDAFFEEVMVMADDEVLKNNRIALLGRLYRLMNQFADLSKLASA